MPATSYRLLRTVRSPQDLRGLAPEQLEELAEEIRHFLIDQVSQTGGHLGPEPRRGRADHRAAPGVRVPARPDHLRHRAPELRAQDPDRPAGPVPDPAAAGRPVRLPQPRPSPSTTGSANSHASTALSYADGLAKALRQQGRPGTVVAFVGDGSLTGGMAWEALNNIAAADDLPLVIVVNDNGRSYTPTVGGLANHLSGLRTNPRYEQILDVFKRGVSRAPLVGGDGVRPAARDQDRAQGRARAAGHVLRPGPEVRRADRRARHRRGGARAAAGQAVRRPGAGALPDPQGQRLQGGRGPRRGPLPRGRQDRRRDRRRARRREAARPGPTSSPRSCSGSAAPTSGWSRSPRPCSTRPGCTGSPRRSPTGASTSGSPSSTPSPRPPGWRMGGLHPVVAVYSTFLNRAFDQLLMDVALHRCGVTFVLDRAGVTGPDGASHHGMWDMSILQLVPGLHLAAPRDGTRLREALARSLQIDDAPSVLRFSKDQVPADLPAAVDHGRRAGRPARAPSEPRVLVVGLRPAGRHSASPSASGWPTRGSGSRWSTPSGRCRSTRRCVDLAAEHELVITIEDNGVVGGCGARLAQELRFAEVRTPIREFGIPQAVPRPRQPGRAAGRGRPDAAGDRPLRRRGDRPRRPAAGAGQQRDSDADPVPALVRTTLRPDSAALGARMQRERTQVRGSGSGATRPRRRQEAAAEHPLGDAGRGPGRA